MVLPAAVVSLIIIVFETILRLMRPIVLLLVTHEFLFKFLKLEKLKYCQISTIAFRSPPGREWRL